jgi:hypothetical protein
MAKVVPFNFEQRLSRKKLTEFSNILISISNNIGFRISSRGWCYQLEGYGYIDKSKFDKVENWINRCRKEGVLPIDFVAEEEGRKFSCVHVPEDESLIASSRGWLTGMLNQANHYTPDWWDGEEYYIQMLVEKIDLKTLFEPVCNAYHIPIATSKGWSSMLQRAEYAARFKEAEDRGLKCVLLYCGDHDPDGTRISDFIMSNLRDLKDITWLNGQDGYDPEYLTIQRFGLNYDFIIKHKLTWIDNLVTGNVSKHMDLSSPKHKNHFMPYVQAYLKKVGPRKCEANAIVPMPEIARNLVTEAIQSFVGPDALKRFEGKRKKLQNEYDKFLKRSGLDVTINEAIRTIDDEG